METINHFGRRLCISRLSERPDAEEARFTDQTNALRFLRSVMFSGMNMRVLRDVLNVEAVGAVGYLLDDHSVLERLSWMLCSVRTA